MTATVILTKWRDVDGPGQGFEYLAQTWSELRRQIIGGPAATVVVDVTGYDTDRRAFQVAQLLQILGPRVSVRPFERPPGDLGGNKAAYFQALRMASEADDSDVLVFEDDLAFCMNAYPRMLGMLIPQDLDWLSFFAPHVFREDGKSWAGIWRTPAPSLCLQAIKYRRSACRQLVEWADARPDEFIMYTAADQALDVARQRLGLRWGVHCPELVQHIGAASNMGDSIHDANRTSKTWPGNTFNALRLFQRDDLYQ